MPPNGCDKSQRDEQWGWLHAWNYRSANEIRSSPLGLPDYELFTPGKITALAYRFGLLGHAIDAPHRKLLQQRIRISLGRLSNNRGFPDEGDGLVTLFGQSPTAGWFGWRWKEYAQPLDSKQFERLAEALAHLPEDERNALLGRVKRK